MCNPHGVCSFLLLSGFSWESYHFRRVYVFSMIRIDPFLLQQVRGGVLFVDWIVETSPRVASVSTQNVCVL